MHCEQAIGALHESATRCNWKKKLNDDGNHKYMYSTGNFSLALSWLYPRYLSRTTLHVSLLGFSLLIRLYCYCSNGHAHRRRKYLAIRGSPKQVYYYLIEFNLRREEIWLAAGSSGLDFLLLLLQERERKRRRFVCSLVLWIVQVEITLCVRTTMLPLPVLVFDIKVNDYGGEEASQFDGRLWLARQVST